MFTFSNWKQNNLQIYVCFKIKLIGWLIQLSVHQLLTCYLWPKFNFLKYQKNVLESHLLLNLNYPVDLINMTSQPREKKILPFHFRQSEFKIWVLVLVQIAPTILLLLFSPDCVGTILYFSAWLYWHLFNWVTKSKTVKNKEAKSLKQQWNMKLNKTHIQFYFSPEVLF